jgi:hypothetical protein
LGNEAALMVDYKVPPKVEGDTFTAGDYERYMRHNFAEGVPGIFTEKGDIAAANAKRQAGALAAGEDYTVLNADSSKAVGVDYSAPIGVSITSNHVEWYLHSNYQYRIGFDYVTAPIQNPTFIDLATNESNFIVPEGYGGFYLISLTVYVFTSSGCYTELAINGDVTFTNRQYYPAATVYCDLVKITELSAGDYFYFTFNQVGDTTGNAYYAFPYANIYKLR